MIGKGGWRRGVEKTIDSHSRKNGPSRWRGKRSTGGSKQDQRQVFGPIGKDPSPNCRGERSSRLNAPSVVFSGSNLPLLTGKTAVLEMEKVGEVLISNTPPRRFYSRYRRTMKGGSVGGRSAKACQTKCLSSTLT